MFKSFVCVSKCEECVEAEGERISESSCSEALSAAEALPNVSRSFFLRAGSQMGNFIEYRGCFCNFSLLAIERNSKSMRFISNLLEQSTFRGIFGMGSGSPESGTKISSFFSQEHRLEFFEKIQISKHCDHCGELPFPPSMTRRSGIFFCFSQIIGVNFHDNAFFSIFLFSFFQNGSKGFRNSFSSENPSDLRDFPTQLISFNDCANCLFRRREKKCFLKFLFPFLFV